MKRCTLIQETLKSHPEDLTLYRINLFMRLLRLGRARIEARDQSDIDWDQVGTLDGQYKYLHSVSFTTHPNLLEHGEWGLRSEIPKNEMADNDIFSLVINLVAIKEQVDERIGR